MGFFKETALYKEMLLLEFISNENNISQPDIARHINAAVSMTHNYIEKLEKQGFLKREYKSKKVVHYNITEEGINRKQYLQISYVRELMDMYLKGQNTVEHFLNTILNKQFKKILLYGAGEVADIILTMIEVEDIDLKVVGIIDDDKNKQNKKLKNIDIISLNDINKYEHNGIVITSFAYEQKILDKLNEFDYPESRIIKYFER